MIRRAGLVNGLLAASEMIGPPNELSKVYNGLIVFLSMYFLLSKALGTFAWPSNVILTAAVIGLVLLPTPFARVGKRLLIVASLSLFVIAVLPIGSALTATLEARFPPWQGSARPPDGVIVLGGVIS